MGEDCIGPVWALNAFVWVVLGLCWFYNVSQIFYASRVGAPHNFHVTFAVLRTGSMYRLIVNRANIT